MERPGTFKIREVAPDGTAAGDTRVVARYVLAITKCPNGQTMIRLYGGERLHSNEQANTIWERWKECQ